MSSIMPEGFDERYEEIKKEIKVDKNGIGRSSVRGTARLAGASDTALRKTFESAATPEPSKLAQYLMGEEFRRFTPANLASWLVDGVPDLAIGLIVEYFAFDAGRYCNETAKLTYRTFAVYGIREWMQKLAGWKADETKSSAPALPPPDVRVSNLVQALGALDIDLNNPRWKSGIQSYALDILGVVHDAEKSSDIVPVTETWASLVEIAEEMGFKVAGDLSVRTRLGQYIASYVDDGNLDRKKEKRLCNGTHRKIWVYKDTEYLRELILQFNFYLGETSKD